MATQDDTTTPEIVSETLEDAFAGSIGRIQEFIEDAPGLDKGSPEQLAELVRLARSLEARTTSLWADIADDAESKNGAHVATKALFRRLRRECEGLTVDECVQEMRTSQWEVFDKLNADEEYEDRYRISHHWTEKGLRYAVALLRLECAAHSEID